MMAHPNKRFGVREAQVLRLLLLGYSRDAVAKEMGIRETSVKNHIDKINKRLPGGRTYSKRVLYGALGLKFRIVTSDELVNSLKGMKA